jgi:hypothetical protein
MFRQVITFANRTACFSPSFSSVAKSRAVLFFRVVRVGNDFQLPRFAREPDLAALLLEQRMRDRLAARHVAELLGRGEVRFEFLQNRRQFRREGIGRTNGQCGARGPGHAAAEKEPPRQFPVLDQEAFGVGHGWDSCADLSQDDACWDQGVDS